MAERTPFLVAAYRELARLLTPLFNLLFLLRSRSGKEIPARKGERFGRAGLPRPKGRLVWIHAASVGETVSVLPLVERLVAENTSVLMTTVTVTAAELAEQRLPEGALHQFVPYDAPGPIGRFLMHWSPDLVMVVESEIWPCLFEEMRRRDTPFVLVNGRLSDGSRRNWSRLPRVARYIFGCLDLVLAQSKADAARFRQLGCAQVEIPGNLKFDAAVPAADETEVTRLKAMIGDRPVWLAALTHPGEEELALAAHRELRREFAGLLLVLVPRHPARADAIAGMLRGEGETVSRRSLGEDISGSTGVYLGDTLGEMGLYYRLAPVTFLGGSFNDAGGHNPVEAALAGSALVTGPNVANARAVYKDFWIGDAAKRAATAGELTERVALLLREPERASQQAGRAGELVAAGRGALDKTMQYLKPCLAGRSGNGARETGA
ncbi:MAG: lipid IV(A) 3-deoxy-D-manno-octulosonic acid transferase [Roseibium sp.]